MIAVILAALLAGGAQAQVAGEFSLPVDNFGGQNNFVESSRLKENLATSAINVKTDRGVIEKRPGSTLVSTMPAAVANLAEYVKPAGTRVLVAHSSTSVLVTDLGTSPIIIATVPTNGTVDFVTAFSNVFFVDGTNAHYYNGVSTTIVGGFPGCKYIEFGQNRLWCANISAESTSEVRISSYGSYSYWTVHADPTSEPDGPNLFYIQRDDGQNITCLKNTPWGMVVGKRRSMHIIKGLSNSNWYIRPIDTSIGCVDDRSMRMVDGRLEWLGVDGVYSYTEGGGIKLESLAIEPTIKTIRQSANQTSSWALDGQSDWLTGNLETSGQRSAMSATVNPGSLTPSTWSRTDQSSVTWANASFSATSTGIFSNAVVLSTTSGFDENFLSNTYLPKWSLGGVCSAPEFTTVPGSAFFHQFGECLQLVAVNTSTIGVVEIKWRRGSSHQTACLQLQLKSAYAANDGYFLQFNNTTLSLNKALPPSTAIMLSTTVADDENWHTTVLYRTGAGYWELIDNGVRIGTITHNTYTDFSKVVIENTCSTGNGEYAVNYLRFYNYNATGTLTSAIYDTGFSTPTWGNFEVSMSSDSQQRATFEVQSSTASDGGGFEALTAQANKSIIAAAQRRFVRYQASYVTEIATASPRVNSIRLGAATTGYYLSPVHYVGPDISSYGMLDAGQTIPAHSTISYQVRQATYSFSALDATPAWSNQIANQTIGLTVSTPTYFQWRSLLEFVNGDAYPSMQVVRANWTNGLPSASVASGVYDHTYFLCVAISSSANDTCLVQQRNGDWVTMTGIPAASMVTYDSSLYAGSTLSDGKVWHIWRDGVYNDDGAAIAATWETPDYMFGEPVAQKALREIWMDATTSSGTLLSVGYAVDRSTSFSSKNLDLSYSPAVNRRVPIDAGFALGKYIRLRFYNAQDKYFRINGFTLFGTKNSRNQ